jgi:hypothetical protein
MHASLSSLFLTTLDEFEADRGGEGIVAPLDGGRLVDAPSRDPGRVDRAGGGRDRLVVAALRGSDMT